MKEVHIYIQILKFGIFETFSIIIWKNKYFGLEKNYICVRVNDQIQTTKAEL